MQRRPTHELLDDDLGTPKEVADSLLDLRWFNRWFGGIATTCAMIQTIAHKTGKAEFSLLEVAAGDGSLMQAVRATLQPSGIRLKITLLDRAPSHLPAFANSNLNGNPLAGADDARVGQDARVGRTFLSDAVAVGVGSDPPKQTQRQERQTEMPGSHQQSAFSSVLVADALTLPFRDSAFDLISCSLFMHHLAPEQAVLFAKEALRVCSVALLIHDLIRSPLHLALAYAGSPLYRSRLTRNDAPASVRQAYTVEEIEGFLHAAGAEKVDAQKHYFYRMAVIAWKGIRPE